MRLLIIGTIVTCTAGFLTSQSLGQDEPAAIERERTEADFAFRQPPVRPAKPKKEDTSVAAASVRQARKPTVTVTAKPEADDAPEKREAHKPRKGERTAKPRKGSKKGNDKIKGIALKDLPDTRDAMMKRFKDPVKFGADIRPGKSGPSGSDWEDHYRSLLQKSEVATGKGYPSHADAKDAILAAATSDANSIDQHLYWVVFIKKFSQKYRPPEATDTLEAIYKGLLDLKYGVDKAGS